MFLVLFQYLWVRLVSVLSKTLNWVYNLTMNRHKVHVTLVLLRGECSENVISRLRQDNWPPRQALFNWNIGSQHKSIYTWTNICTELSGWTIWVVVAIQIKILCILFFEFNVPFLNFLIHNHGYIFSSFQLKRFLILSILCVTVCAQDYQDYQENTPRPAPIRLRPNTAQEVPRPTPVPILKQINK